MPFAERIPQRFTSGFVRMHAPELPGVYGISNAREWIYIGAAGNIQHALLAHLGDPRTLLMQRAPAGFVFEICESAVCAERQARLVLEYRPICNQNSNRYA